MKLSPQFFLSEGNYIFFYFLPKHWHVNIEELIIISSAWSSMWGKTWSLSKRKNREKGIGENLKRQEGIYATCRFPKKKKKKNSNDIIYDNLTEMSYLPKKNLYDLSHLMLNNFFYWLSLLEIWTPTFTLHIP